MIHEICGVGFWGLVLHVKDLQRRDFGLGALGFRSLGFRDGGFSV